MEVEEALVRAVNDNLVSGDDMKFMRVFAERAAVSDLTTRQRHAAWRVLTRVGMEVEEPDGFAPPQRVSERLRSPDAVHAYLFGGDRIAIKAPFKYKDVCKALNGRRWDPDAKVWHVPASPEMAAQISSVFTDVELADEVRALLVESDAQRERMERVLVDPESLDDIPITLTKPWPHQLQAFWFAYELPAAMLAMEMGTGKSKVAVDLMVNRDTRSVLVQCPKSVLGVWNREFRVHAGEHFHVEVLTDGRRSIADRAERAAWMLDSCVCGKPHALVINYEAAWQKPFAQFALSREWGHVVFDESHRIKAPNGTMSKFCAKLRRQSEFALALSGTPMAQSPLDVWGQYRALDPSIFGPSFVAFKYKYAIMGGWQGKEVIGMNPDTEADLAKRYFSIAFEVGDEVLDLLEPRNVDRVCLLEPAARKHYDDLYNDFYTEVDEAGGVTTPNVLVKLLRCQQLTGGALGTDDGEKVRVSTAKADLLLDVVEDANPRAHPVVVFCRFIHDLDVVSEVAEKLKLSYGELSGRRNDLTEDATMPEGVDVLGVQIQTGGVGIDLTRARVGIYYSVGYSLSDYKQSRKRILRPGQEGRVTFVHLMCADTVDEEVYAALQANQDVIDRVRSKGR